MFKKTHQKTQSTARVSIELVKAGDNKSHPPGRIATMTPREKMEAKTAIMSQILSNHCHCVSLASFEIESKTNALLNKHADKERKRKYDLILQVLNDQYYNLKAIQNDLKIANSRTKRSKIRDRDTNSLNEIIEKAQSNTGAYHKAETEDPNDDTNPIDKLKQSYLQTQDSTDARKVQLAILNAMIEYPELTLRQVLYVVQKSEAEEHQITIDRIKDYAKRDTRMKELLNAIEPGWDEKPGYMPSQHPRAADSIMKLQEKYLKKPDSSPQRKIKLAILNVMIEHPELTLKEVFYAVQQQQPGDPKPSIQSIKESAKAGRLSNMEKLLNGIEPGWYKESAYKPKPPPKPINHHRLEQAAALQAQYLPESNNSEQRQIQLAILDVIIDHPILPLAQVLYVVQQTRPLDQKPSIEWIKECAKEDKKMASLLDAIKPGWFKAPDYKPPEEKKDPTPSIIPTRSTRGL